MGQTLQLIRQLVARGEIRISEHGYDELSADNISVRDLLHGVADAVMVEDYPEYFKGPLCARVTNGLKRAADSRGMGNPKRRHDASGGCDRLQAACRQVVR